MASLLNFPFFFLFAFCGFLELLKGLLLPKNLITVGY
jgi:hypothetical protein